MFNVVVVSPRNYFLYTPLLPGVATGAIETRSIVESIRRPIAEKGFKYYEAAATGVDAQKKTELLTMHMSRQQQMRWKKERDAQLRAEDDHYASELKKLNVHLREEEAVKIRDKFERNKQRDAYLLQQMEDKSAALKAEKLQEMYEAEQTKQWGQDDDAIFDQYAQMCLDEYVSLGKNPRPIEMVMRKIKESSR